MTSSKILPNETTSRPRQRRLIVAAGIALFVVGFVVTVSAVPKEAPSDGGYGLLSAQESGSGTQLLLAVGVLTSIAGVLIATVVPVVMAMRSRGKA
ncbi:MAG: hypothetical protein QXQ13_05055 [Thermoplasmata archaeon]